MKKGHLEDNITKAIIKFEKEHLGRGPEEVRTFIIEDMILIRLKGVLTPAEQQLAHTDDGRNLIKQLRMQLMETSRGLLEQKIYELTGMQVVSMHTDISTTRGERILVLIMEGLVEVEP